MEGQNRITLLILLITILLLAFTNTVASATCGVGEYYDECHAVCVDCPPGHYCSGTTTQPVPCAKGTASAAHKASTVGTCNACPANYYAPDEGSVTCQACPASHTCADPTVYPVPCPAGTYTAQDAQATCLTCPAGHYCAAAGTNMTHGGAVPCPKGTAAGAGNSTCATCGMGWYADQEGSASCTQCPAGTKCPRADERPIACTIGTYSPAGSRYCDVCPAGHYCMKPDAAPQLCPAGTFSPRDINHRCIECPLGTYAGVGAPDCNACPAGMSCTDKQSAAACPAGEYSQKGHHACEVCPTGTLVNGDQSGCVECAPGQSCTGTASNACPSGYVAPGNATLCTACPPGTFANGDRCDKCPIGFACVDGTTATACATGTYALGGATMCTPIPAGARANATTPPSICPVGTYSPMGAENCLPCPAGKACFVPTEPPSNCPAGSYSEEGDTICRLCPSGSSCNNTGITDCPLTQGSAQYSPLGYTMCIDCPAGFYCNVSTPMLCPPGTYAPTGSVSCITCPAGSFCLDPASAPVTCPDGTVSAPGAISCDPCDPGKVCTSKVKTCIQNNCLIPQTDCPVGQFSSSGSTTCTECPAGFACPAKKGFSPIACTPGTYSAAGATSCTVCPAGSYCYNSSATPVACSPGTYSSAGAAECTICPAGHFCQDPTQVPQICPNGRYSLQGESSPTCQQCAEGFYCLPGATSATPGNGVCAQGQYCDNTGVATSCPAGTVGIAPGQKSSATGCATCPAGYHCAIGTSSVGANQKCPRGYYCPAGTTFSTEFPCPQGTYNPKTGSISASDCITCPAGYYCDQGTNHYGLTPCPVNYYCPDGTHSRTSNLHSGIYRPRRCPRGTYYPATAAKNLTDCQNCPQGQYCYHHNFDYNGPQNCPSGTYQPHIAAGDYDNCLPCPRGHACPARNAGQYHGTRRKYTCYPGYACREYTQCTINGDNCIPTATFRCPAGTFTTSYHLKDVLDCSICWEGYACDTTSGPIGYTPGDTAIPHTITMTICAAGHYCPGAPRTGNGSHLYTLRNWDLEYTQLANQYDCPPGTWSDQTGLKHPDECKVCPEGRYCVGGESTHGTLCPAGHYCPGGTDIAKRHPCPAGTYYNDTGLTNAYDCIACPAGSYCPEGSSLPTECPAGTYAPGIRTRSVGPTNSTDNSGCVVCPPGHFCSQGTVTPSVCQPGNYSKSGQSSCKECPAGRYCPLNTTTELQMLNTFICPEGTYCPMNKHTAPQETNNACPAGSYCPAGTPAPIACPAGTYGPHPGFGAASDCITCPKGEYCVGGQTSPTGNCTEGYYCEAGSYIATQVPCPARTYRKFKGGDSIASCVKCTSGNYCPEATGTPIPCPPGHYCIIGTVDPEPCPKGTYNPGTGLKKITECLACPPGKYCDTLGQKAPSGDCDSGYYCVGNAFTAAPQGPPTGGLCPRGGFCPTGSSGPSSCAPGSFNNFTGGKSQADCAPCTPGHYCAGSSNPYPTGKCSPGYYCLSNDTHAASNPRQFSVTPGHYSVAGAQTELPCEAGTWAVGYNSENTCDLGDPGYYFPTIGMKALQYPCPAGSYCSAGTILPRGCPRGTFGASPGLKNSSQCVSCPVGKFCDSVRLTAHVDNCLKGYLCTGGAAKRNPVNETYGDRCPAGHWCGVGATTPTKCGVGKFNPDKGMYEASLCIPCRAGTYCQTQGAVAPTGLCAAGTYCPAGLESTTSTGTVCTTKHYCPNGTAAPIPCPQGTETLAPQKTSCDPCIAGKYCYKASTRFDCSQGHYCPAGTGVAQPECPPGSYSTSTTLTNKGGCTLCDAGKFCSVPGLTAPNGDCLAGAYCVSGARDVFGTPGELGGSSGQCELGNYCVGGQTMTKCPVGSFGSVIGLQNITDCSYCEPGKYCPTTGLTNSTLECHAGHYCTKSSDIPNPTDGIRGNLCTAGHYCPNGTASPIPCPEGTYASTTGQHTCAQCPAGKYCAGTTITPQACPQGRYCPAGTGVVPPFCPPGSYSNVQNLEHQNNCTLCTGGKFCSVKGLTAPNGDCKAGIECTSGASDAQGTPGVLGGSSGICPAGHYCGAATTTPSKCPIGKYANWTGGESINTCQLCPPGLYCDTQGIGNPDSKLCAAGYYCVLGATTSTPNDGTTGNICPTGHYCPQGSSAPIPCAAGTFQNVTGQSTCHVCTAGKWCISGTTTPTNCTAGSYCPAGSQHNLLECPPGSFSNQSNLKAQSECTKCSPGKACTKYGLTAPDAICDAGIYCVSGASKTDGAIGVLGGSSFTCPKGSYCPAGSHTHQTCAAGQFQNEFGKVSSADCIPCTAGKYCASAGTAVPDGDCYGGYYCPISQTSKTPAAYQCQPGYYCPNGTSIPIGCPDGTFSNTSLSTSCYNCPAGYTCTGNSSIPEPCPVGYYCPAGSSYPTICKNGTYGNATMRIDQSQCLSCPAGSFCGGGVIVGLCSAGWVCTGGSPVRSPSNIGGYICPIGHYCPEGVTAPITCPTNFYSNVLGGRDKSVCGPCPKGYYCDSQSQSPCLPGYYCPYITGLKECPIGTYNPISHGSNLTACLPCPQGFVCNKTKLASLAGQECPTGHICPEGTIVPLPCGAGTYRNVTNGHLATDCFTCPAGYYCGNQTTTPVICPQGRNCEAGSFEPQRCPRSSFCPTTGTHNPYDCPSSYYCPENSITPIACPLGSFCGNRSYTHKPCPLGYKSNTISNPRDSIASSCDICPAGYFGNHTISVFSCLECDAGYICYGNSSHPRPIFAATQHGEPCSAGHYCPRATTVMIPCPIGTHRPETHGVALDSCAICPANTYQHKTGSVGCEVCGTTSTSTANSSSCSCTGANRAWFITDNTCRCKSGYTWYDEDNVEHRDIDGLGDCVVKTNERCAAGFDRNAEGKCVASSSGNCESQCTGAYTYSTKYGVCQCNDAKTEAEIEADCDAACRAGDVKAVINSATGTIEFVNASNPTHVISSSPADKDLGENSQCSSNNCTLITCRVLPTGGFAGRYNPSSTYLLDLFTNRTGSVSNTTNAKKKRTVFSLSAIQVSQPNYEVSNPVMCIEQGSGVIWDISGDVNHYPKYVPDDLLNTNPEFDYGLFLRVADEKKKGSTLKVFTFVFSTVGVYSFVDAANSTLKTIVNVVATGSTLCGDKTFRPITQTALEDLNISGIGSVPLDPDWNMVGVLLIGIFVTIGSMLTCWHYFTTRMWSKIHLFKKKNDTGNNKKISKVAAFFGEKVIEEEKKEIEFDINIFDMKMSEHGDRIKADVDSYRDEFRSKYAKILAEAKTIRRVLEDRDKMNLSVTYNTQALIEALPDATSLNRTKKIGNTVTSQEKEFKSALDHHQKPSLRKDALSQEQIDRMNTLDRQNIKQRERISKLYVNVQGKLESILAKIESEGKNADKSVKNDLVGQFNNVINEFRIKLEASVNSLNDILIESDEIMQVQKNNLTFHLDAAGAEVVKNFLRKKIKELFDRYRLDQQVVDDGSDSDDSILNFDDLDEESDEDLDDEEENLDLDEEINSDNVDENRTAEERLHEEKKRIKKRLAANHKEELKALNEEIENEFQVRRHDITKNYKALGEQLNKKSDNDRSTILGNSSLSLEDKRNLLRDFDAMVKAQKEALAKQEEEQQQLLKELLEKKRAKKLALLEKRQERERKQFLEGARDDKLKLKQFVQQMLQDGTGLSNQVGLELLKQKEALKNKLAVQTQKRLERQEAERLELEESLDTEDKLDLQTNKEQGKAQMKSLVELRTAHEKGIIELRTDLSDDQKQDLLKKVDEQMNNYRSKLDEERKKDEEKLKKLIIIRRTARIRQLEKKHQDEENAEIKEKERDLIALKKLMEQAADRNQDLEGARAREKLKQSRAIQRKIDELIAEQRASKKANSKAMKEMEESLAKEKVVEIEKIAEKFAKDRKKQIKDKTNELQEALAAPDVDEAKKEKLLATHKLQLQDYDEKMEVLRNQQLEALERRMAEKLRLRKKEMRDTAQKNLHNQLKEQEKTIDKLHENDTDDLKDRFVDVQLSLKQKQELEQLEKSHNAALSDIQKKHNNEAEREINDYENKLKIDASVKTDQLNKQQNNRLTALKSKMEASMTSSADNEKQRIQEEYNHQVEALELKRRQEIERQENDIKAKIAARRKKMEKKRDRELEKKKNENAKVMTANLKKIQIEAEKKAVLDLLMNDNEEIQSIEDAINRVLMKRHQKEIATLAQKHREERKTTKLEAHVFEVKITEKRVALKRRHIEEKKALAKEFEKYRDLISKGSDDTRAIEEELERFQAQIAKQKAAAMKKIAEEKEALQKQMEEELRQAREAAEREKRELMERLNKQKNKMQVENMLKEREMKMKIMLEKKKNLASDEKSRLLDEARLQMNAFEDALDAERIRQNNILKERIRKYERIIAQRKEKELQEEVDMKYGKTKTTDIFSQAKEEVDKEEQEKSAVQKKSTLQHQNTVSLIQLIDHRGNRALPTNQVISIEETEILKERPYMEKILKKLKKIENLMDNPFKSYVDARDAQIKNEGELVMIQPDQLSIIESITMRYGDFIVGLLKSRFNFKRDIKLAVASKLPFTDYGLNCFKHSFYYDFKRHVLFIRRGRLDKIGMFTTLLVHCIAHIIIGDLDSDYTPEFKRTFYSMMESVFEDVFNTRHTNKLIPSQINQTADQLVNYLVNTNQHTFDASDGFSRIKVKPTGVKTSMPTMQAPQKPRIKYTPKAKDNTAELKTQLESLLKDRKQNEQVMQQQALMVKKIKAKLQQEAKKLQSLAGDKESPAYKKQANRVRQYKVQHDEALKKIHSAKKVNTDMKARINELAAKIRGGAAPKK